jgi:hypothetical protein
LTLSKLGGAAEVAEKYPAAILASISTWESGGSISAGISTLSMIGIPEPTIASYF